MMKKIKQISFALLAVFALAGCDKESDSPDVDSGTAVQFTGSVSAMTRATDTAWDGGDEIGVFMFTEGGMTPAAADNVKYTESGSGFSSTTPIYYPQSGNVDFVAYYPWRETPGSDPYVYKVNVATQTSPAGIDLLWSDNATGKTKSTSPVALDFDHKLSQMVLNIKAGDGMTAEDLAGMTVKITGMPTTADFALANGTFSNASTVADITPIDAMTTTVDYVATCTAIVIPQTANAWSDRKMVFTVGGVDYTYNIPIDDDFASGYSYTYSIAVNENTSPQKAREGRPEQ